MPSNTSKLNRRSGPVSGVIGAGLMIAPSVFLIVAALHTPTVPPLLPAFAERTPARAGVNAKPSGCISLALPADSSVGNAGGDPYAFHEFTREETLAAMRRDAVRCASSAAAMLR